MGQDPLKKEENLRIKLDEYEINMPEFSVRSGRWEKFIYFLVSPTKNPLESFMTTTRKLTMVKIVPIVVTIAITFIQFLVL